jgi:hypothetical protein
MINEYHVCIVCGRPFRSEGVRLYCNNSACLDAYVNDLNGQIREGE